MSRNFEERMNEYVRSLGEDHPPSDSHFSLRHLYFQYGVVPVDDWLNIFYGKVIEDGKQSS